MNLQSILDAADPKRLAAAQAGVFDITWKRRTESDVEALVYNRENGNVYHTGFNAEGGSYCSCPDKRHRGGGNPCKHSLRLLVELLAHPELPYLNPPPDLSLVKTRRNWSPNGEAV